MSSQPTSAYPLGEMFERIEALVAPYPRAAMFELALRGHGSLFEQLTACILSIRTLDEVSLPAAEALFRLADTAEAMAALEVAAIEAPIAQVTYAPRKAEQIREMARVIVEEHGGQPPADDEVVRSFKGIGPKCTNLALGIAAGLPRISVDTHVHRVVNRWGLVERKTPEATLRALEEVVPDPLKIDVNRLLMPFGKHHCTRYRPACDTCPVLQWCEQRGVKA